MPDLFQTLRGVIDRGRRKGKGTGRFLILGSASVDLLRQSGETLAGRITYIDLAPFSALEVDDTRTQRDSLWLRGGFPDSYLAADIEPARAFVVYAGDVRYPMSESLEAISIRELATTLRALA